MARVALLEDAVDFREEIADFLADQGHSVLEAGSIAAFLPLMDGIDIAIIDVGLPDGDGRTAAAALRAAHPNSGIIMLTAQGGISDKITSLRDSADYYLVKPVHFDELQAHIAALTRRLGMEPGITAAPTWRLQRVERKLSSPDGRSEPLTEHEMVLLELLAAKVGAVVSRREIATAFGVDWLQYDERRLDQIVSRLRRRWRSNGPELPVRTEHGKGYTFCAEIEVV